MFWLANLLFVYSYHKQIKIKVMLSKVENKGIKISAIVALYVAFGFTGLFGFAFVAGCLIGEIITTAYLNR
jgi:hypothetical protein